MANFIWPDDLPQMPLWDGYQETLPNLVLRTQMDAGVAKVRRRFTAGPRAIRCFLSLTTEQKLLLEEFYLDTTAAGADRFEWVRMDSGETADYRFAQPPQSVPVGPDLWKTQLVLELMPS